MKFTEEHAAKALRDLGIDFAQENFPLSALVDGMNAELRHGRKARGTNLTDDDPTMTAMLAVNNLRVSPSYYSGRVGKSAWERSLSRGVKHRGGKTEVKTIDFELEDINTESWTATTGTTTATSAWSTGRTAGPTTGTSEVWPGTTSPPGAICWWSTQQGTSCPRTPPMRSRPTSRRTWRPFSGT